MLFVVRSSRRWQNLCILLKRLKLYSTQLFTVILAMLNWMINKNKSWQKMNDRLHKRQFKRDCLQIVLKFHMLWAANLSNRKMIVMNKVKVIKMNKLFFGFDLQFWVNFWGLLKMKLEYKARFVECKKGNDTTI